MQTIEILLLSGVVRGADFKPPRPTRSFSGSGLPQDALWTDRSAGASHVPEEPVPAVFSRSWWKDLWLHGR